MKRAVKVSLIIVGSIFGAAAVAFAGLFYYCTMNSCHQKGVANDDEDTICSCPPVQPDYFIIIQPYNDFSRKKAQRLKMELKKELKRYLSVTIDVADENLQLPQSLKYKPRNRYWATKIMDYNKYNPTTESKNDPVTIGILDEDISTSIHGRLNYGIMGLSYRPGLFAVISTYRLKNIRDLWKLAAHEYFHSLGLSHCVEDNPKCIMRDARGGYPFRNETGLCKGCQRRLHKIIYGKS